LFGSEYLGPQYKGGEIINGIRHEDVEALSFSDNSLDLIVSNDVFEHVPNIENAFRECLRVLVPGGTLLSTFPFHCGDDFSVLRAEIKNNNIVNLQPEMYHGNPVSEKGSLVFHDFGWDLFPRLKEIGFSQISIEVYSSAEFAHLGGGQVIFRFTK
jgi:ubiquinone/menaquinone biosynthesis C-methylase UbiE